MTPEQLDRATKWLARRSILCGCGSREFEITPDLIAAPTARDGPRPRVMVITVCTNCAHIHAYDAKAMGLIET